MISDKNLFDQPTDSESQLFPKGERDAAGRLVTRQGRLNYAVVVFRNFTRGMRLAVASRSGLSFRKKKYNGDRRATDTASYRALLLPIITTSSSVIIAEWPLRISL